MMRTYTSALGFTRRRGSTLPRREQRGASVLSGLGPLPDGFYINGAWVKPTQPCSTFPVINPATELPIHEIHMASAEDVDRAVQAARAASADWAETSPAERVGLLRRLAKEYKSRSKVCHWNPVPSILANATLVASCLRHALPYHRYLGPCRRNDS